MWEKLGGPWWKKKFMAGVEKSAKLLTSMTKLQEMLKTIESEVASRTAGQ
jgi:hypothetical protein